MTDKQRNEYCSNCPLINKSCIGLVQYGSEDNWLCAPRSNSVYMKDNQYCTTPVAFSSPCFSCPNSDNCLYNDSLCIYPER